MAKKPLSSDSDLVSARLSRPRLLTRPKSNLVSLLVWQLLSTLARNEAPSAGGFAPKPSTANMRLRVLSTLLLYPLRSTLDFKKNFMICNHFFSPKAIARFKTYHHTDLRSYPDVSFGSASCSRSIWPISEPRQTMLSCGQVLRI